MEEVKRFEEDKFQTEDFSEVLFSFGNILRQIFLIRRGWENLSEKVKKAER